MTKPFLHSAVIQTLQMVPGLVGGARSPIRSLHKFFQPSEDAPLEVPAVMVALVAVAVCPIYLSLPEHLFCS